MTLIPHKKKQEKPPVEEGSAAPVAPADEGEPKGGDYSKVDPKVLKQFENDERVKAVRGLWKASDKFQEGASRAVKSYSRIAKGEGRAGVAKSAGEAEAAKRENADEPTQESVYGDDDPMARWRAPTRPTTPARVVRVPGGWIGDKHTQTQSRDKAPMPKAAVQAYMNAINAQKSAAGDEGVINAAYAKERAGTLKSIAEQQKAFQEGAKARDAAVHRVVGMHRSAIQRMEADVAAKKLKPLDHWARGSVLGAIVAGISGFGAGLTGGENQFLKNVKYSMDKRYQAQLDELKRDERSIDRRGNELSVLLKLHGDAETAKLAHFNLQMKAMETNLKELAQQHEGTLAGVRYKRALAALEGERGNLITEVADRIQGKVQESLGKKYMAPKTLVVGGGNGKKKDEPAFGFRKRLSKEEQAEVDKVAANERAVGVPDARSVLDQLEQSMKVPRDIRSRMAAALNAGDASRSTAIFSTWLHNTPEGRQALAYDISAKSDMTKMNTGAGQTPGERANAAAVLQAWTKAGPVAGYNVMALKHRRKVVEAGGQNPEASLYLQDSKTELWRRHRAVGNSPDEKKVSK